MSTQFIHPTADSNLVRLTIAPELIWGQYNKTINPEELRITGESLSLERGTITSTEIRSDRQITDLIATKETAGGDIQFEFSARSFDTLFEAGMFNSWTELVTGAALGSTGVEVVVFPLNDGAGNRFTDRVDMWFKTPQNMERPTFNLIVGQVFRLTSSNQGQGTRFNGYFQVIEHRENPPTTVTDQTGTQLGTPQNYTRYTVRKVRRVNEDDFVETFPMPAADNEDDDFYNDFQIVAADTGNPGFEGPLDYSLNGRYITNGSQKCSVSIEKHFEDTKDRIGYSGLIVSTWNISTEAESIVTGSFSFMGRGGDVSEAVVADDPMSVEGERFFGQRNLGPDADPVPQVGGMAVTGTQHQEFGPDRTDVPAVQFGDVELATTTEITNSGRNISSIRMFRVNADGSQGESLSDVENLVMSLSLNIDNGTREKLAIGDVNLIDVGIGQYNLTGDISIYFTNATAYNRFLADEAFAISFTLGDDAGNAYNFYLPNCKLTQSSPNAGSANTDIMLESGFQALRDRGSIGTPGSVDIRGTGRSLVISQIAA